MSAHSQPTVLLVRSQHLSWTGLRVSLVEYPDLHVVGEVWHPDAAKRIVREILPTLIIAPDRLVDLPIVTLLRELNALSCKSKMFIIGRENALSPVPLVELQGLPVIAYVYWVDLSDGEVADSLSLVLATNLMLLSPVVAKTALTPSRTTPESAMYPLLTNRESEIFRLAGAAIPHHEIAAKLCVSKSTVQTHVQHIRQKLEFSPYEHLGAAYHRLMGEDSRTMNHHPEG